MTNYLPELKMPREDQAILMMGHAADVLFQADRHRECDVGSVLYGAITVWSEALPHERLAEIRWVMEQEERKI